MTPTKNGALQKWHNLRTNANGYLPRTDVSDLKGNS